MAAAMPKRDPERERLTERVELRLTPTELRQWMEAAAIDYRPGDRLSLSDFIRRTVAPRVATLRRQAGRKPSKKLS